ncbi:hypothetical protein CRYUN_Cryun39dG0049000 [Craigia yunnanensis]
MCLESSKMHSTTSQKQNQSKEVKALLAFKHNSVEADHKGFLDRWSPASFSPCSWLGISCSASGQVNALNFTNAGLIGHLLTDDLLDLENLQHLHLSGNSFSGNLFIDKTSRPCTIETLDLSFNNLSESISKTFFDSCDHLTSLNLSHNSIRGGSFDFGDIPALFFANLPRSLEFLDISYNKLSGNFSILEFGNCAKLLVLNLSNNALYGSGISQSLTNCKLLENLDFSHNQLRDKTPTVFGNLRNLKHLNLAQNNFSGNIPRELGWACGTLVELDLSGNKLSGGFPETFKSCSSLKSLNLGDNQLYGNFLTTVISTLHNLQILQVPLNNISGSIPLSLGKCTQLQVLNLRSNAFTGNIPLGFCSSSTPFSSLQKLLLAGNLLSGIVPSNIGNCKNLRTIDFSLNNLSGSIPPNVWMLPHLSDLILWGNSIGGILEDMCFSGSNLETLLLSNNLFTGEIPSSLSNCKNLTWLSLSFNQLSGEILADIGTLQKLSILQLNHNSLTGRIPPSFGNCQSLLWLDLSNNQFTGNIPSDLANKKSLVLMNNYDGKFAYLRSKGERDCNVVNRLLYLEGIRPERLDSFLNYKSCSSVIHHFGLNMITSNGSMIYLDLSSNLLSGPIPDNLGLMSYLIILNLGYNRLTGAIPETLGSLKRLEILDLSHNQLEGTIPGSLGFLSFLSDMDLSNNNLSGPIPIIGQIATFPASAFENNSGLCDYPLPPCVSLSNPNPSGFEQSQTENPSILKVNGNWVVALMGYIGGVIVGACAGIILFEEKKQWFMKTFSIILNRRPKQVKYSRQTCHHRR